MTSVTVTDKKHRKSQQRKIILETLKNTHVHPTAKELYKLVQKKLPDIGLATIYRNLELLEKQHKIIKLKSKDKETRYDGKIEKHFHFICRDCGHILDITDVEQIKIKSPMLQKSGFKVDPSYAEMFGVCRGCL